MISIKEFFDALYQDAPGHLVIWTKKDKKTRFISPGEWNRAAELAGLLAKADDVYFGVALQDKDLATKDGATSRGTANTATAIPGFFADIDIGAEGHSGKTYPPTAEAALEIVAQFPLAPTIVVHTGGGLHCYWLFKEQWVLENDEERAKAKELSRRFQQTLIALAAKRGFSMDNTADLARLLRVPGTFNHKTGTPRPVEVIELQPKNTAEPSEFEQYLIEETVFSAEKEKDPDLKTYPDLSECMEELRKIPCEFLQFCIEKPAEVSEPLWLAAISNVARFPQKASQLCHGISKSHPKYRREETDAKILHGMDCPPITCSHIQESGFQCSKSCTVKSPAGLWVKASGNRKVEPELDLTEVEQDIQARLERVLAEKKPSAALEEDAIKNFRILATRDPRKWAIVKDEFKRLKVPIRDLDRLIKQPQPQWGKNEEPQMMPLLCQDTRFIVPNGYAVDENGTYVLDASGYKVNLALSPTWVSGRIVGIEDGKESLELSWRHGKRVQAVKVPRKTAMDANSLIDLADDGFPVNSENKTRLAGYLSAFESSNMDRLPAIRMATQMGWVGKGSSMGFLLGRTHFPPNQEAVCYDLSGTSSDIWKSDGVIFGGPYSGQGMLADSLQPTGSYEEWLGIMDLLSPYPIPQLLIYASCIPPLQEILGIPNFGVCIWQETSLGKSIALEAAASIWGQPTSKSENAMINSWNLTPVFFERTAAFSSGIPLFMDDTKEAKAENVGKLLYMLGNGIGRGRGNVVAVNKTSRWNTVMFTSGEGPLAGFTQDAGARARCVDIHGMPFGPKTPESGILVKRIRIGVRTHYGHAAPKLLQYLTNNSGIWTDLKAQLQRYHEEFAAGASSGIEDRMLQYLAACSISADLLHRVVKLPWNKESGMTVLREAIASNSVEVSIGLRALRDVSDWIYSNAGRFLCACRPERPDPSFGVWNRWKKEKSKQGGQEYHFEENEDWEWVLVNKNVLKDFLKKAGYSYDAVVHAWNSRGWLIVDKGRNTYDHQVKCHGLQHWGIAIKREAFAEIGISAPVRTPSDVPF